MSTFENNGVYDLCAINGHRTKFCLIKSRNQTVGTVISVCDGCNVHLQYPSYYSENTGDYYVVVSEYEDNIEGVDEEYNDEGDEDDSEDENNKDEEDENEKDDVSY